MKLILFLWLLSNMANKIYLDSATTFHAVNDASLVYDVQKLDCPIKVGTGNGSVIIEYAGSAYFIPYEGVRLQIKLNNVVFNPSCSANLISLGCISEKYWFKDSKNNSMDIKLKSSNATILYTKRFLA